LGALPFGVGPPAVAGAGSGEPPPPGPDPFESSGEVLGAGDGSGLTGPPGTVGSTSTTLLVWSLDAVPCTDGVATISPTALGKATEIENELLSLAATVPTVASADCSSKATSVALRKTAPAGSRFDTITLVSAAAPSLLTTTEIVTISS